MVGNVSKFTKHCKVEGCESESNPKVSLSYYTIPADPKRVEKWLEALNLTVVPRSYIICSAHFSDDCFSSQAKAGVITFRHLNKNAVPNINIPGAPVPEDEETRSETENKYEVKIEEEITYNERNELEIQEDSNGVGFVDNEATSVVEEGDDEAMKEEKTDVQAEIELKNESLEMDTQYVICDEGDASAMYELVTEESQILFQDGDQQYIIQYEDVNSTVEGEEPETPVQPVKPVKPKRGRARKKDKEIMEYFEVTALSVYEQIEDIQSRAASANYINAAYKCDLCFKGYMTENTYNSHMVKHGEQSGPFQCVVCQQRCQTKLSLKSHMLNHAYKYGCRMCDFCTRNKCAAELHMNWHLGTLYQCETCKLQFERVSTLLTHVRIKHPSDFVCGLCGYSFIGEKGLNYHTKLKHRLDYIPIPSDGPRCESCDIQFATEDALNRHVKVSPRHSEVLEKERNEPPQPKGLRRIRNRCKKTQPPVAAGDDDCGVQVSTPREYHVHYRRAHPTRTRTHFPQMKHPQLCDHCGRVFTCQATLKDHLLWHSGEAKFQCGECGHKYKTMNSLQNHQRIHLGPRFLCPLCGKKFNQQSNRDRHFTYVHSDERRYKCDHCEKWFKNKEDTTLHINHVHLKKPWPKRNRNRPAERRRRNEGDPEIIMIPNHEVNNELIIVSADTL